MGIFASIFGRKKKLEFNDKPRIYGGDGLSAESPAIVNCASIGMAQLIVDSYLKEKCGEKFERGIEYTIAAPDGSDKLVKVICANKIDGSQSKFYFDLSRPMAATMKILDN